jgi:hypothetical protein
VAEVMEKNNSREIKVHQGRELIRYGKSEMRDGMLDMKDEAGIKVYQGRELTMHEEPETRAVMIDTTEAVRLDMKYEASIEDYQGRKLIMNEKPEPRDGMLKTNSKSMIKSLGEAAFENILDRVLGKHRVHEKPGMRAVMDDIFDAAMLDMKYEAGIRAHQGRELIMHEKLETRNK